jgi:hypothetical protein
MAPSMTTSTGTAASSPASQGGATRATADTPATHAVTTRTRTPTSSPHALKVPFGTSNVLKGTFRA